MRAGKLRHTIAIQQKVPTDDETGGKYISWVDVPGLEVIAAEIWADISDENLEREKLEQENRFNVRIRYHPGIKTSMRIYWHDEGKALNIISYKDKDMRHKEILLKGEELIDE